MFFDEFWYKPVLATLLGSSPWMVFDGDDGKGGDDDKGGGGGGSADDKGGKTSDEPQTFTLKIKDTEKVVTLEEMQELATKSAGADEAFRKAADMRKEAETLVEKSAGAEKIVKTFNKLFKEGDYTKSDIREFGEMVGLGGDEMEKMFAEELKKQGKSDVDDAGKFRKLTMEDFDEDTQETLKGARQTQVVEAEKKIAEMVKKAVDKDEFFGTILKDTDEKQRESRKAAIEAMVKRDVNRRILSSPYTKEVFGDQMIKGSVQEIRADIKKYGIPTKASEKPVTSNLAALGLSGDLQTKIQADETIERVPVDHPDYLDNIVARMAQGQNIK